MAQKDKNLNEIIGLKVAEINEIKELMRKALEEKDAEIALLNIRIDKLQNPEEPNETYFGEKNEA